MNSQGLGGRPASPIALLRADGALRFDPSGDVLTPLGVCASDLQRFNHTPLHASIGMWQQMCPGNAIYRDKCARILCGQKDLRLDRAPNGAPRRVLLDELTHGQVLSWEAQCLYLQEA